MHQTSLASVCEFHQRRARVTREQRRRGRREENFRDWKTILFPPAHLRQTVVGNWRTTREPGGRFNCIPKWVALS